MRALVPLRPIESLAVFSPSPDSRARFSNELADLRLPIRDSSDPQAAVEGANLIICAARSHDESPTIRGGWLQAGTTIVSIGSTLPEQRELDPQAVAAADLIVADMPDEVAHDTGDMIAASAAGVDFQRKLIGLDLVIGGRHPGRTDEGQILLYKSVGAAIQDLAVAAMCVRRALASGVGVRLPIAIQPVSKGK